MWSLAWRIHISLYSKVESIWTSGLQVDSRWILDKELAGLTPIKKKVKSPPGVHLSTWNLWLRVKSSTFTAESAVFIYYTVIFFLYKFFVVLAFFHYKNL